jgi:hypothetical protein
MQRLSMKGKLGSVQSFCNEWNSIHYSRDRRLNTDFQYVHKCITKGDKVSAHKGSTCRPSSRVARCELVFTTHVGPGLTFITLLIKGSLTGLDGQKINFHGLEQTLGKILDARNLYSRCS